MGQQVGLGTENCAGVAPETKWSNR